MENQMEEISAALVYKYLTTLDKSSAEKFKKNNSVKILTDNSPTIGDIIVHYNKTVKKIKLKSNKSAVTNSESSSEEEDEEIVVNKSKSLSTEEESEEEVVVKQIKSFSEDSNESNINRQNNTYRNKRNNGIGGQTKKNRYQNTDAPRQNAPCRRVDNSGDKVDRSSQRNSFATKGNAWGSYQTKKNSYQEADAPRPNAQFRTVDDSQDEVGPRLHSNSYAAKRNAGGSYREKVYNDLTNLSGKAFRRKKGNLKRRNPGFKIDKDAVNSIKFPSPEN